MFLVPLKTVLVQALRLTFNSTYPETDFQNLHVSIEFPAASQDYPGIWVNYEPMGNLTRGGIDTYGYLSNIDGTLSPYDIWRFEGYATYTIGALTSLQRDRLFDEMVRIMAFYQTSTEIHQFRGYIENNPYLAMNMNFDAISMRGTAETPGTPWGTDDIIYETTVAIETVGEIQYTPEATGLPPLSEIIVTATDPLGNTRTVEDPKP